MCMTRIIFIPKEIVMTNRRQFLAGSTQLAMLAVGITIVALLFTAAMGTFIRRKVAVLMELEGDDIYAVGMFGLIYGRYDNLQG